MVVALEPGLPAALDARVLVPPHFTQRVVIVVLRKSSPHKSVNLSFTITNIKSKLMDLCGN